MRIVNQPDSGDHHHPLTLLLLAEDGLELLDAVGGGQPRLARQAAKIEKCQNFSRKSFLSLDFTRADKADVQLVETRSKKQDHICTQILSISSVFPVHIIDMQV